MSRSRYLPVRTRRALAEQAACQNCGDPGAYQHDHKCPVGLGGGNEPENLQRLCVYCHAAKSRNDIGMIAKANRLRRKADGTWIGKKSRPMQSRGFDKSLRKQMDGTVERRE